MDQKQNSRKRGTKKTFFVNRYLRAWRMFVQRGQNPKKKIQKNFIRFLLHN